MSTNNGSRVGEAVGLRQSSSQYCAQGARRGNDSYDYQSAILVMLKVVRQDRFEVFVSCIVTFKILLRRSYPSNNVMIIKCINTTADELCSQKTLVTVCYRLVKIVSSYLIKYTATQYTHVHVQ